MQVDDDELLELVEIGNPASFLSRSTSIQANDIPVVPVPTLHAMKRPTPRDCETFESAR